MQMTFKCGQDEFSIEFAQDYPEMMVSVNSVPLHSEKWPQEFPVALRKGPNLFVAQVSKNVFDKLKQIHCNNENFSMSCNDSEEPQAQSPFPQEFPLSNEKLNDIKNKGQSLEDDQAYPEYTIFYARPTSPEKEVIACHGYSLLVSRVVSRELHKMGYRTRIEVQQYL